MAQHKWHKEIIAWANGAEIEEKYVGGMCMKDWTAQNSPAWHTEIGYVYRIKPREYTYYTKVKIIPKTQGIVNTEFDEMASYHTNGDNLKLSFDKRGTLIKVELIGDGYESE